MKTVARIALTVSVMLVVVISIAINTGADLTPIKEATLQIELWVTICTALIIAGCGDYE